MRLLKKPVKRAIVLLSGGLDSATALFIARARGYATTCLIFDYGQRHRREVEAAKSVARRTASPFYVLKIHLPWKGSALLDKNTKIPVVTGRRTPVTGDIPVTYVPGRNTIFLSFALSLAETLEASDIFIGANAIDYSGYPDCRPDYYKAFALVSRRGTRCGVQGRPVKIQTPLIRLTKAQIIQRGVRLGVPYELTWSCYKGGSSPCGVCDSCRLRSKGFREAGVCDPYES
jgi:7-cyano-7-deazaguanine synthase